MSMDDGSDGLLQEIDDFGLSNKGFAQLAQILTQIVQQNQQMMQILMAPKQSMVIRDAQGRVAGAQHQVMPPQQDPNQGMQ
jgi:hypothetical protein